MSHRRSLATTLFRHEMCAVVCVSMSLKVTLLLELCPRSSSFDLLRNCVMCVVCVVKANSSILDDTYSAMTPPWLFRTSSMCERVNRCVLSSQRCV